MMDKQSDLESIADEVVKCRLCNLCIKRKNAVPGEGNHKARLFIVGEAPGKNEDLQGRPFVGMSGRFLTRYMEESGIKRSEVFITNAVKCRPPNNRKPKKEEIEACRPYLIRQLLAINPRLILALGTSAASSLGLKFEHLSEVRGKIIKLTFNETSFECMVTFHPSFPMRFPRARDEFSKDLLKAKEII